MSRIDPPDQDLAELTRAMLRAAAAETPAAPAKQRALLTIRRAAAGASVGTSALLLKIVLSTLALSAVVLVGTLALRTGHPESTLEIPPVASLEAPTPTVIVSSTPPVETPKLAPSASAPSHARAETAKPKESSLAAETAMIAEAHAKLSAGDASGCLGVLDRYQRTFPRGLLSQEALIVRIQALLARGDRSGAESLGRGFLARNPTSPYAPRVRSLLGVSNP